MEGRSIPGGNTVEHGGMQPVRNTCEAPIAEDVRATDYMGAVGLAEMHLAVAQRHPPPYSQEQDEHARRPHVVEQGQEQQATAEAHPGQALVLHQPVLPPPPKASIYLRATLSENGADDVKGTSWKLSKQFLDSVGKKTGDAGVAWQKGFPRSKGDSTDRVLMYLAEHYAILPPNVQRWWDSTSKLWNAAVQGGGHGADAMCDEVHESKRRYKHFGGGLHDAKQGEKVKLTRSRYEVLLSARDGITVKFDKNNRATMPSRKKSQRFQDTFQTKEGGTCGLPPESRARLRGTGLCCALREFATVHACNLRARVAHQGLCPRVEV